MYSEKGQTLIELIVVMSVSVIVVGALVFATIASLRNSQFSKYQVQATKLAQEGIEKVRSARDRNGIITGLTDDTYYWNSSDSTETSIWDFTITSTTGCPANSFNYFKIIDDQGTLNWKACSNTLPDDAELLNDNKFKRVVILSDDSSYATQKTVTVIVRWTDFSGDHESRLTTILGKL